MNAGREHQTSFQKLLEYEQRSLSQSVGRTVATETVSDCPCVVFRLGSNKLALPIDNVGEILDVPQHSSVPGSKPWILGLANVRGNLVTVCDLMWFLSGIRSPLSGRSRLVVTNIQKHPIGLVVDEVLGQRHFNSTESVETSLFNDTELDDYVSSEFDGGGENWGFFELENLLGNDQFLNGAAEG